MTVESENDCEDFSEAVLAVLQSTSETNRALGSLGKNATLATAIYCIRQPGDRSYTFGGLVGRSGGTGGVSGYATTSAATLGTVLPGAQIHAETSILGALIDEGIVNSSAQGFIRMTVDNPSDGLICDLCIGFFDAFRNRYTGIDLVATADCNRYYNGAVKKDSGNGRRFFPGRTDCA